MIIIVVMDCSTFAANVEKLELLDDDFAGVRAKACCSVTFCAVVPMQTNHAKTQSVSWYFI